MIQSPQKQQVADSLIDSASAVFARHGFARTSIQVIADAAGYSKAGLLHHFTTKQAVFEAAVNECRAQMKRIVDRTAATPAGVAKDRYTIELLVDLALARPGLVALLLSGSTPMGADNSDSDLEAITAELLGAFDLQEDSSSPTRYIQVVGALAALSVLSLNAHQLDETTAWRGDIVRTSLAALGHPS